MDDIKIDKLAKILSTQIEKDAFDRKYAPVKEVLTLVGAGAFLIAAVAVPNLPQVLKPFLRNQNEYEVWKRFNLPYLKRTLQRLEKRKMVEIVEKNGMQEVKVTSEGRQKILAFALDGLFIKKPKVWDKKWRLVSFDLPEELTVKRKIFVDYLKKWNFYPLHKSVYFHAYPCLTEVEFLREYLGIGEYVKMFVISKAENEQELRKYFGV